MFSLKRKTVKRSEVPYDGKWFYDNYEKILEKTNIEPSVVTEAIFGKELARKIIKEKMKVI